MGLRSSKHNRTSYNVASAVSNKDFSFKRHTKLLPKVELPTVIIGSQENLTQTKGQEIENKIIETNDRNEVQDPRVPDWVNKEIFKKLLLKTHANIKDLISFKAFPAIASGENYSTLLLRVQTTVKFEDDTLQNFFYMLKVAHDTKEVKDIIKAMNFFRTENTIYAEIIPELEEMYRQVGVEAKFAAKSYKLDLDDPNIQYVLMDDLCENGFKNANRLECLNMEHTLCVLRKMAQFHAATACRVAKKGVYGPMFSPNVDNDIFRAMLAQMFSALKKPFLDNLKTYNDGEKYYDLMDQFFDNLIDLFIRSRKLLPDYFNVLNHGDSWSNNILFKYTADGKLLDVLYCDFQNSNWGSPAIDLYYFIISSVQIDIKLSQFDYFVRYYHEHLTHNLKLLEYPLKVPSLRAFHIQMIDFGSMATITASTTLAIVLLDPTDKAKFENFMADSKEGNDFRNSMYTSERYRKYINEILPWLYNRGFMEINLIELDNRLAAADNLKESLAVVSELNINNKQLSSSYRECVNETLFIDVVRADCGNYQKIMKFIVNPAITSGSNYLSIMLQVDIDIELADNTTRSLSYMLKIPPHDKSAQAIVTMLNAFEKETTAYYETIPQLENVYKEYAGVDIVFAPKIYKLSQTKECKMLVLENLKNKDFRNYECLEGLDMEHTKAVLKKLAVFHAASAYAFEINGKFPKIYEHSLYSEKNYEIREKIFEPLLKLFQECVQEYNKNEEYIDNVIQYLKVYNDRIVSVNNIDWKKFNVLNHGNCWTNNIMFQHDNEGNIKDIYFVDFEFTKYGSPAYDLYYFLLSSPKLELKLEHFDYFVCYYHGHLATNLELLKYPKHIPSLGELHKELLNSGAYAIYTVMGVMAFLLLDPSDKANLEQLINSDDNLALKRKMFLSNCYKSHVEAIFLWLNRRGHLNAKESSN